MSYLNCVFLKWGFEPLFILLQMEKYSKHLESIVAERTQDLLQEKQKTDRLLYSALCVLHVQKKKEEEGEGRHIEIYT